ncbi:co-chaperone YbbN [Desulfogranum marinum]|uniref:thioredoxin family protein n=1 Tax=Desulfogranum marinum TaxID=453220 RepID=UPI0019667DCF|nr:thioredoxin family protein [Desulfogranum marinum]MBM9510944.1 thioredoxin family protein [Desulfogranum marinum]
MKIYNNTSLILVQIVLLVSLVAGSAYASTDTQEIPVPGMVTMVDLGAKKCIPCKMMAPVMEELEKEYAGRAAIVFIDVWEKPNAGKKFGIRAIPTQIFYDSAGIEVLRHEGFFDKASIVAELQKLGVK